MELLTELILIQRIHERLIQLLFVQLVRLSKEVFHLRVVILFTSPVLENTQNFYLCHCVKREYWVLPLKDNKKAYQTGCKSYTLTPSTHWTSRSISRPESQDLRSSAAGCWVSQLRVGRIWKTAARFTCWWLRGNEARCRSVVRSFEILGFTSFFLCLLFILLNFVLGYYLAF